VIKTPGNGLIAFQGMQDHTAESIKSLEGYGRAWVEEAQTLSPRSLALLRPTIRADNSELWFSWNPTRKSDPVDLMFRGDQMPTGATVVRANWSDNPWFPAVLEQERLDCLKATPDQYDHIWEGGYATVLEGAYYAACLAAAKAKGQICKVAIDPLMQVKAFWDIGGTGQHADATAIVVAQFVGREIRVLDYYEAVGQPLATHLHWLRSRGWSQAHCYLPHDGGNHERTFNVTYEGLVRQAGFSVEVVPNAGSGAYMLRIEAGRRMFPSIWFNAETTQPLIEALGWYHEKRDPVRQIGLGEFKDWSNDAADAFGMMCIAYEAPLKAKTIKRHVATAQGWMG
jgi:phage terminase large subunit